MALDNLKRKLEGDKKAKADSPYSRVTIIPLGNDKVKTITKRISFKEWLEDREEEKDEYEDNPEDPEYRRMMEGEDW